MTTHRVLLIILILLGSLVRVVAQDQASSPPDQNLLKEYVSPDHRFKIRFPDVPKEFDLPLNITGVQVVSHSLMHTSNITYWLAYTDFPIDFEKGNAVKAWLDKGRDGSLARVAKEEPRILAESDISVDGHPGRFLRVELKGDAIVRYQIVLAANRQYVISVGTPKGDAKDLEAQKSYDKLAANFFDSFIITPPLEADLTATWKELSSAEGRYRIQFPGTPLRLSFALESLRPPAMYYVEAYTSSGQYTVMYLDYAEAPAPADRTAMKQFLDDLRDGQLDQQERIGAKLTVVSETGLSLDGYPGRLMVMDINNMAFFRVKTIVVKKRVYSITVFMPKDDPKASDPKVYERLSMKFINSFSLIQDEVKH